MNVHAKSRLTPEPLRTLRSETKGQAGACPDRTRAIPCTVRAITGRALGATLGATRMNNLRMPRTHLDNRQRQARGHELI